MTGKRHMWKKRVLACILAAALSVSASAATGLGGFNSKEAYADTPFADVPDNAWFYDGIVFAYEKGIMNGVGDSQFNPAGQVTAAQAITIAARVYATYWGEKIGTDTAGAWYQPYYDCVSAKDLLPPTISSAEGIDSRAATRSELAYLFAKVVKPEDLPAINDSAIPDLEEIDPASRDAVALMYGAGIITGKEGGRFDGNGTATRAEIATILSRLLDVTLRVTGDSRYPAGLAGQEGNAFACGMHIRYNGKSYHTVLRADGKYCIQEKSDAGLREVYAAADPIGSVTIGQNGLLVREERSDGSYALIELNPETQETRERYRSQNEFSDALEYGDTIYVIAKPADPMKREIMAIAPDGKAERVLRVDGICNAFTIVLGEIYYVSASLESIASQETSLYRWNAETETSEKICTFHIENFLLSQNLLYYTDETGIRVRSIQMDSGEKTLYSLERANSNISMLNVSGKTVFFGLRYDYRICALEKGKMREAIGTRSEAALFYIIGDEIYYTDAAMSKNTDFYVLRDGELITQTLDRTEWGKGLRKTAQTIRPEQGQADPADAKEVFRRSSSAVFYIETKNAQEQRWSSGSGFFINASGVAVTNYHVIQGAFSAFVRTADGQTYAVEKVLGGDPDKDIAILQVDIDKSSYLKAGDSSLLESGDRIYTLGSPKGLENTISDGIVSNPNREIYGAKYIQISAPITDGSSGGALLDESGNVVGITTASYGDAGALNVAIPIEEVARVDCANPATFAQENARYDWLWYERSATIGSAFEKEPNDTPTDAYYLYNGETAIGTLSSKEDQDWFLVECNTKGTIEVTLTIADSAVQRVGLGVTSCADTSDYKIEQAVSNGSDTTARITMPVNHEGYYLILVTGAPSQQAELIYTLEFQYVPAK